MFRAPLTQLLLLSLVIPAMAGPPERQVVDDGDNEQDTIAKIRELPLRAISEVVWLARCSYSESNRPHEQRLVAWVVRNRVETEFRGRTYREVVLTPRQFSAFNEPSPRRRKLLNLTLDSQSPGWSKALDIAYRVYTAPAEERPFSITTRHFYSPVSRSSPAPPPWAKNETPVSSSSLGVLPHRFKFYEGIDQREKEADAPPTLAHAQQPPSRESRGTSASSSDKSSTSLKEMRQSIRRRLFRGRVERPRRPTVKHPSRPDRQR